MKVTIFALSFALVAIGCADQRTARRDPYYGSTNNTTAAAAESSSYSSKSSGTPTTTTSGTSATSSTDPALRTEPHDTGLTNRTWGGDTSSSGTSDRDGAAVTTNAGVADHTRSADNTRINDRDRHGTLTPGDQGNSAAETRITAEIRKGLMASKQLSFTAKNAKVITTGTRVTLRGTVMSDEEKTQVESVAKSTPGVSAVDNQLEVKK